MREVTAFWALSLCILQLHITSLLWLDIIIVNLPRKSCPVRCWKTHTCRCFVASCHYSRQHTFVYIPAYAIFVCLSSRLFPSGGDKVSMWTHTYPHKLLRKIKVTICNHQADRSLYVWPNVWSGNCKFRKKIWLYMTLNVLTETRCH